MPPQRPRLRRSVRLQAKSLCSLMASSIGRSRGQRGRGRGAAIQSSATLQPVPARGSRRGKANRARGGGPSGQEPSAVPTPTPTAAPPRLPNITWDESRVRTLVDWIINHPADRRLLFNYQDSSPVANEKPSAGTKKGIHTRIAIEVFSNNEPDFDPKKPADRYVKSVSNRIISYVDTLDHALF